jgi:glutamate synthase domain-containing protein 3
MGIVELEELTSQDVERLRTLIERHVEYTGSSKAADILSEWEANLPRFVKVMPKDYKRALRLLEEEEQRAERELAGSPA